MAYQPYQPFNYYPGMQQFPTMPQSQPQPQQVQGLQGRTVDNLYEVTAQDVPMNGTAAFFPLSDGTAIFSRSWKPDGTVQTIEYRPVQNEQNEPMVDLLSMQNDIANIKDMLTNMQKPATKSTRRKATDEPTD